jgi:hypothetical protein
MAIHECNADPSKLVKYPSKSCPRHLRKAQSANYHITDRVRPRYIARLLTRASEAPNNWLHVASACMEECDRLQNNIRLGRRLYSHIAENTGIDIKVSDLEIEFGFRWAPLRVDSVRMTDPYSSRVLDDIITRSFAGFLTDVDRVCSTLPGLNPGETTVNQEVTHASNLLWHRVGRRMCDPECTQSDLLSAATSAYNEILESAHRRAQERITAQANGVKALQRLCAAASDGTCIGEILEVEIEHLGVVTNTPPPSLEHELTRMGVPLITLRDLLFPNHVAVPMSGVERHVNVTWWARAYSQMVGAAALVVLPDLHLLLSQPPSWRGWDGIGVWTMDSEPVRVAAATGGIRAVAACPTAVHTYSLQPFAILATAEPTSVALRVARLARTVLELVNAHALCPRCVKAECLLALVQRFEVATSFEHERVLRRLGEISETDHTEIFPVLDEEDSTNSLLPSSPGALTSNTVRSTNGALLLMPALLDAHRVPKSLLRDYVVVLTVRDRLAACPPGILTSYVGVSTVVAQLNSFPDLGEASKIIRDYSSGSLRQSVTHIMKKVVERVVAAGTAAEDVNYGKTPSWVPGCSGLVLTLEGRRALSEYLDQLISRMLPPEGPAFAKEWHCSRSALSHARRKQVTHAGGSVQK